MQVSLSKKNELRFICLVWRTTELQCGARHWMLPSVSHVSSCFPAHHQLRILYAMVRTFILLAPHTTCCFWSDHDSKKTKSGALQRSNGPVTSRSDSFFLDIHDMCRRHFSPRFSWIWIPPIPAWCCCSLTDMLQLLPGCLISTSKKQEAGIPLDICQINLENAMKHNSQLDRGWAWG